jgi:hypothetical protein
MIPILPIGGSALAVAVTLAAAIAARERPLRLSAEFQEKRRRHAKLVESQQGGARPTSETELSRAFGASVG